MDHVQEKWLAELFSRQSGVIARRQVLGSGGTPADIERKLRRCEWVRLLPGVFQDHTGEASWLQRAWAGVLFYDRAALAHASALRPPGRSGWRGYDDAALDVAAARSTGFGAIEVLADVCQQRRTTADRMLAALERRSRLRRRRWLAEVLRDIDAGTCSVLEHGYLQRVERRHGLPTPRRQSSARIDRGTIYRDVDHREFDSYVELDGRLFHDTAGQRDRDLERDLAAAVDGRRTVRLGWGQVFDRPCGTAGRIGRLLQQRGWAGAPRACGPECTLWTDNPVAATRLAR